MLPPFGRIFGMGEKEQTKEEHVDTIEETIEETINPDEVMQLPLAEITPNRYQPRSIFNEEKIAELLSKNNIPFEKQKTFNTCILPSGYKARFDFYVNNSFLIEFDGIQHFEVFGRTDELELENIKNKDVYKNNWCKINGIPLKRIPYLDIRKFTFEDLMSDKYLINKE